MKTKVHKIIISYVNLHGMSDEDIETILLDNSFNVESHQAIAVEWSDDNKYNKTTTDFLTEFDKDFEKANRFEYSPDYLKIDEEKTNFIRVNSNQFVLPLQMTWQPKEDITTYELALCLPYILYNQSVTPDMIDLSQSHFRHFKIYK